MGFSRWFVLGFFTPLALLAPAREAKALMHVGGDIWCQGLWVDGAFQGLGMCYDLGAGGGGGTWNPPPGESGGGGGAPGPGDGGGGQTDAPPDFSESPLSEELRCSIRNYVSSDLPLGGRNLKWVNTYAFGKLNADGLTMGYAFSSKNVLPSGPGWMHVGGITSYGTAYGRLYKGAKIANTVSLLGVKAGRANKVLNGSLTSFEMQLMVAAHELSHLAKDTDEPEAIWYGIDAVLARRQDGNGRECNKPADPKGGK